MPTIEEAVKRLEELRKRKEESLKEFEKEKGLTFKERLIQDEFRLKRFMNTQKESFIKKISPFIKDKNKREEYFKDYFEELLNQNVSSIKEYLVRLLGEEYINNEKVINQV